jgi:hypothetical protein
MTLNELIRLAPALLRSPTARVFESGPGRGKTSVMAYIAAQEAKRRGEAFGFARIFAPTLNPIDVMGFTKMLERTWDGIVYPVSESTLPAWMRMQDEAGRDGMGAPVTAMKAGLLIIEEEGQAELEVKKQLANLKLEKMIGPHRLPEDWRVWSTTNRASDRSGVTKNYDHIINRENRIAITDDLQSWKDWAFRSGLHPDVIAWGDQNPQTLFSELPEKQGPFSTPRSVELCEKDLRALSQDGVTLPVDGTAVEVASGTIGAGAAASLMVTLRLGIEMPRYEDIVRNPSGVKVPSKPDAMMLVCFRLAAQVSKVDAEPVIEYMQRMPQEFALTFARSAANRDKSVISTPAFHKWCVKNASLVTAMADLK